LANVWVSLDPGVFRPKMVKTDASGVDFAYLCGTLLVDFPSESTDLTGLVRWRFFLNEGVTWAFAFSLFNLLYQLCGNVERGEIFSERNTRLIRYLGLAILGYQAVGCAAGAWYAHLVGKFLREHVVAEGLKMVILWSDKLGKLLPVDLGLVVTGLLVVLLSEVFRQGLALKQENELTV